MKSTLSLAKMTLTNTTIIGVARPERNATINQAQETIWGLYHCRLGSQPICRWWYQGMAYRMSTPCRTVPFGAPV
ncbi:MAG: hypothetical protein PHY29_02925 [Syntrophales bacterium]|nr:hypothetical protein [Syntrophales bacterium]